MTCIYKIKSIKYNFRLLEGSSYPQTLICQTILFSASHKMM